MRGITAPKMCELADIGFKRFETLRRRQSAALELNQAPDHEQRVDLSEAGLLPLGVTEEGKWVRYGFGDTLRLAVAVALETAGVEFGEAVALAGEAGGYFVHAGNGDFWIARSTEEPIGETTPSRRHVAGDIETVIASLRDRHDVVASVLVNVSHVARRVTVDAARMGFAVDGERFIASPEAEG